MGTNHAERGLKLSLPKKRVHPYLFRSKKRVHPYMFRFRKIVQAYLFRSKNECRPICSALKNDAGQPGPHLYGILYTGIFMYFYKIHKYTVYYIPVYLGSQILYPGATLSQNVHFIPEGTLSRGYFIPALLYPGIKYLGPIVTSVTASLIDQNLILSYVAGHVWLRNVSLVQRY